MYVILSPQNLSTFTKKINYGTDNIIYQEKINYNKDNIIYLFMHLHMHILLFCTTSVQNWPAQTISNSG